MAALDTPWMTSMNEPSSSATSGKASEDGDRKDPATIAAFAPHAHSFSSTSQRSTILVHHKSPLLLATPPQVTRALAYSHPFIVPLNKLAGLLSWTTGDPWESFLLVAAFWFVVLYGNEILGYAGPLLLVIFLILGMYFRRYSPLSSTGWTGEKQKKGHKREASDVQIKHRKSLDEILATLQTFTSRCNILLDPLIRLTDFLSTQQTATSATTRPALTALFIRISLASPLWIGLNLPPFQIITSKRTVLVFGTMLLSWHSRPARIIRTIVWRSRTVRTVCTTLTGLNFTPPSHVPPRLPPRPGQAGSPSGNSAGALGTKKGITPGEGIRFTFSLYENQRRWLGIGWTASMLAYERAPWTDEHLNPTADPQHFALPDVDGGMARWRWVEGSEWHVEGSGRRGSESSGHKSSKVDAEHDEEMDWVYYDNKWHDARRGQDGWGRYTRRRKWIRDAELIDADPDSPSNRAPEEPAAKQAESKSPIPVLDGNAPPEPTFVTGSDVGSPPGIGSPGRHRRAWFGRDRTARDTQDGRGRSSEGGSFSGSLGSRSGKSRRAADEDDVLTPTERLREREVEWGLGDDVSMELG